MKKVLISILLLLGVLMTANAQPSYKVIEKRVAKLYPGTTIMVDGYTLIIEINLKTWCSIQDIDIKGLRRSLEQKSAIKYQSESFLKDLKRQKVNFRRYRFAAVLFIDKNIIYLSGYHRLREL